MPTDAEFLRQKTEEGKLNNDFRDLMESINYEIRQEAQAGNSSTTYRLKGDKVQFADAVLHYFRESDNPCDVDFDDGTGILSIDWASSND
ncbi:DUF1433 domain-containing protein [Pseudomonas jessenii]|uniref:hypothetical protein n=1 Tax=Pseudomonas jessenii TaxID=77298 RepID=UPI0039E05E4D